MSIKNLISMVVAALMLTGAAVSIPADTDNTAPAARASYVEPAITAAEPVTKATQPAAVTELSTDQAAAIVLENAGLTAEEAQNLRITREMDDGIVEFDIDFRSGDYEYDYTVNAITGEILEQDKEYDPPKSVSAEPVETVPVETAPVETFPAETGPVETKPAEVDPVVELTADEAIAIALDHAGLGANDVTGLKAKREVDDGIVEFDIDFRGGDYEYEYSINAITGAVMDWDKEYDPPKTAVEPTPAETVPASVELTADEAIAIALDHAGLGAGDVTGVRSKYDIDDGVAEWEVEFRSGDLEYEYTIDAKTGKILEWDKEKDD